jgi:hypothetical protein
MLSESVNLLVKTFQNLLAMVLTRRRHKIWVKDLRENQINGT